MITPRTAVSKADVAQHYDELDSFYLDVWGEHVHHGLWISGRERAETAVRQMVDLVAAAAEILPDHTVCDIGSGYGAAARQIARDYGARVTAVTLSPRQCDFARRQGAAGRQGIEGVPGGSHRADGTANNPTYLLGDWLENGLPSGGFDAAYALECASHMPDPARFLREAARVLKPGGRFVMCAWVASEQVGSREMRYLLEPICREGRLAHLSTVREYMQWLEGAGLSVVQFRDLTRNVRRTWLDVIGRTLVRLVSRPAYVRFLLGSTSDHRIFLLTIFRLWLAYRTGALRYCLFKCRKSDVGGSLPANLT